MDKAEFTEGYSQMSGYVFLHRCEMWFSGTWTSILLPYASSLPAVPTLNRCVRYSEQVSFKTPPHSSAQTSTWITAADFKARRVHLTNLLEKVVKNMIFLRRLLFFFSSYLSSDAPSSFTIRDSIICTSEGAVLRNAVPFLPLTSAAFTEYCSFSLQYPYNLLERGY